jgi:hypothetical protein
MPIKTRERCVGVAASSDTGVGSGTARIEKPFPRLFGNSPGSVQAVKRVATTTATARMICIYVNVPLIGRLPDVVGGGDVDVSTIL